MQNSSVNNNANVTNNGENNSPDLSGWTRPDLSGWTQSNNNNNDRVENPPFGGAVSEPSVELRGLTLQRNPRTMPIPPDEHLLYAEGAELNHFSLRKRLSREDLPQDPNLCFKRLRSLCLSFDADVVMRDLQYRLGGNIPPDISRAESLSNYVLCYDISDCETVPKSTSLTIGTEKYLCISSGYTDKKKRNIKCLMIVSFSNLIRAVGYLDSTRYNVSDVLSGTRIYAPEYGTSNELFQSFGKVGGYNVFCKLSSSGLYCMCPELQIEKAPLAFRFPEHLALVAAASELYVYSEIPVIGPAQHGEFGDRLITYNNFLQTGHPVASIHFADFYGQLASRLLLFSTPEQALLYRPSVDAFRSMERMPYANIKDVCEAHFRCEEMIQSASYKTATCDDGTMFGIRKPRRQKTRKEIREHKVVGHTLKVLLSIVSTANAASLPGMSHNTGHMWTYVLATIAIVSACFLDGDTYVRIQELINIFSTNKRRRRIRRARSESDIELGAHVGEGEEVRRPLDIGIPLPGGPLNAGITPAMAFSPPVQTDGEAETGPDPNDNPALLDVNYNWASKLLSHVVEPNFTGSAFTAGALTLAGYMSGPLFKACTVFMTLASGPEVFDTVSRRRYYMHTAAVMLDVLHYIRDQYRTEIMAILASIGMYGFDYEGLAAHSDKPVPSKIGWQDGLLNLLNGYKAVKSSQFVENGSKLFALVALLPTIGTSTKECFSSEKSFMDTFKSVQNQLKQSDLSVECIADTITYWLRYSVAFASNGYDPILAAKFADPLADKDYLDAVDLNAAVVSGTFKELPCENYFAGMDGTMTYTTCKKFFMKVNKKIAGGSYVSASVPPPDRALGEAREEMLKYARLTRLNEFIRTVCLKEASGLAKPQPFTVTFLGPAGIGKTTAMTSLNELMHHWGGDEDVMNIKFIVDGDKYDSAFDNATTGANWDDAGQEKPEKRLETIMAKLFRFNSSVRTPFVKPEVENKGTCFNNIKYFCISTNSDTLGLQFEVTDLTAALRRMGFVVQCFLRDEYKRHDGLLDGTKTDPLKTKDTILPYWLTYSVFTQSAGPDGSRVRNYIIGSDDAYDSVDHVTLMRALYKQFVIHWVNQGKAMMRAGNNYTLCQCGSGVPTTACVECSKTCEAHGDSDRFENIAARYRMRAHADADRPAVMANQPSDRLQQGFNLMDVLPIPSSWVPEWLIPKPMTHRTYMSFLANTMEDHSSVTWLQSMKDATWAIPALAVGTVPTVQRFVQSIYHRALGYCGSELMIHMVFHRLMTKAPTLTSCAKFTNTNAYALLMFVHTMCFLCFVRHNFWNISLISRCMWLVPYLFAVFFEGVNTILKVLADTNDRKWMVTLLDGKTPLNSSLTRLVMGLTGAASATAFFFSVFRRGTVGILTSHEGEAMCVDRPISLERRKEILKSLADKKQEDGEEPKKIWLTRKVVPILKTASSHGITEEDLTKKVERNLFRIRYTKNGSPTSTNGLFVNGNMLLIPCHVFLHDNDFVEQVEINYLQDGETYYSVLSLKSSHVFPGRDLVLTYVPGQSRPHLDKFFAEKCFGGMGSVKIIRRDKEGMLAESSKVTCTTGESTYDAPGYTKPIVLKESLKYSHPDGFKPGDCIGTCVTMGNAGSIVGFHIAGCDTSGVATVLPLDELVAAIQSLTDAKVCIPRAETSNVRLNAGKYEVPKEEVHPKHCINFMPPGSSANYVESVKRGITPRSDLDVNPLMPSFQEHLGLQRNFGKPNNNMNKAMHPVMVLSTAQSVPVPPELRVAAVEDFLSAVPPASDRVHPYTTDEVLNGIEANEFLFSINAQTSAGFPFNTKKKNVFDIDEEGRWVLTDELKLVLAETLEKYGRKETSGFPFNTFVKDESRTLDKLENSRLIFGGNVITLLLAVEYLGPAVHLLQSLKQVSMCAVGVDPVSPEWHRRFSPIYDTEHPDLGIETDFSKYDMSLPKEIVESVCIILRTLCKDRLGYSDLEMRIVDSVCTEILCPLVNFGGVIMEPNKLWPSGSFLTAIGGSIAGSLLYMCSFYKHNPHLIPDAKKGVFRDHIYLVTLGDDVIGSVLKKTEWNIDKFCDDVKGWGMHATTASNKHTQGGYKHVSELNFLKRRSRYMKEVGHLVGTLDPNSILKPFEMYIPAEDRMTQRTNMMDQSLSEMFLHGKEAYEQYRAGLIKVVKDTGSCYFDKLNYSFESMVARHLNTHGDAVMPAPTHSSSQEQWDYPWRCVAHSETNGLSQVTQPAPSIRVEEAYPSSMTRGTHDANSDVTQALQREVLVMRDAVKVGEGYETKIDGYQSILNKDVFRDRINGFRRFKASIEYRFVMACGPATAGLIEARYVPFNCNQTFSRDQPSGVEDVWTSSAYISDELKDVEGSVNQHILFEPNGQTNNVLKVPFLHYHPSVDMLRTGIQLIGQHYIKVRSLVMLWDNYGQTNDATLSVYARLTDIEISGATLSAHAEPPSAQISALADTVGMVGQLASRITPLALPVEVVGGALEGVAGAARLLGHSRPADLTVRAQIPSLSSSLATADQDLCLKKLTVDSNRQTTVDPKIATSQDDEMSIPWLLSRPTLVKKVVWDASQAVGQSLVTCNVNPFLRVGAENLGQGDSFVLTPSGLCCTQFSQWVGTMHYKIRFVTQSTTTGIATLFYDSDDISQQAVKDVTKTPSFEMNLTASHEFTFSINWCNPQSSLGLTCTHVAGPHQRDFCNGTFAIDISHPLRGTGTVAAKAYVLLYAWADKDMILYDHWINKPVPSAVGLNYMGIVIDDKTQVPVTRSIQSGGGGRYDKYFGTNISIKQGLFSVDWSKLTQAFTMAPTNRPSTMAPSSRPSAHSEAPTLAQSVVSTLFPTWKKVEPTQETSTFMPTDASTTGVNTMGPTGTTKNRSMAPTQPSTLYVPPTGPPTQVFSTMLVTDTPTMVSTTSTPTPPPCKVNYLVTDTPMASILYGSVSIGTMYDVVPATQYNTFPVPVYITVPAYSVCGVSIVDLNITGGTITANTTGIKVTMFPDGFVARVENTVSPSVNGWVVMGVQCIQNGMFRFKDTTMSCPKGYTWKYTSTSTGVSDTQTNSQDTTVIFKGKKIGTGAGTVEYVFGGLLTAPDQIQPVVVLAAGNPYIKGASFWDCSTTNTTNYTGYCSQHVGMVDKGNGDLVIIPNPNAASNRMWTNIVGVWTLEYTPPPRRLVAHSETPGDIVPHAEFGVKEDNAYVLRMHAGERVTTIRSLLKIFRPLTTATTEAGQSSSYSGYVYANDRDPQWTPMNLFPPCYSVMKGSVVSYYRLTGEGVVTVTRDNSSEPEGYEYSFHNGYEILDSRVNPTMMVEYPNYTPWRFSVPRDTSLRGSPVKRVQVDAITKCILTEDTAVGEDFLLAHFIGCPIFVIPKS